jgi:hypothetical protein
LTKVITGLALQRNLMGKGSKRKVPLKTGNNDDNIDDSSKSRKRKGEDDGPTVYKWKRERSR